MRYLTEFDTSKSPFLETDVLIVGSGIAGLTAAFECAPYFNTTVLSKSSLSNTATWYAQGGIASAISNEDSIELHYQDTIKAGAGLCDTKVVRTFIGESLGAISFLRNLGAEFDQERGHLQLALEGGHSKARILHKKDFTGSEVQQKLVKAVLKKKGIKVIENAFSVDLLTERNYCLGVLIKKNQRFSVIFAKVVILATGGVGQLYKVTTNPSISTGDGIAMAWRAGAKLMDMEFIQFHPTSLHSKKNPRYLITEALRGEGAYLRNVQGKRFLKDINPAAELAPRDIVAQAIYHQIENQKKDFVFLDATHLPADLLIDGYPSIYQACLDAGFDITKEMIPVSPAAHFMIGGIKMGLNGQTSIFNLFASGECAATGFHGANRLASNSLLEGVVLSRRIARQLQKVPLKAGKKKIKSKRYSSVPLKAQARLRNEIREQMTKNVSMVRDRKSLREAAKVIKEINYQILDAQLGSNAQFELANLAQLAQVIIKSALWRSESRGVHLRRDFSKPNSRFLTHKVVQRKV